ncbi:MAG: hypothetical protein ABII96_09490 [Candidatus Zixiibacteriota bacterium]
MYQGRDPIEWFQVIIGILLLIVLVYWIYSRFISDQRQVEDAPRSGEETGGRLEVREEMPETARRAAVLPSGKEVIPVVQPEQMDTFTEGAQVAYPTGFQGRPKRGEARFLHDSESGARIWVSGGCPQDYLTYRGGMRNGLAHGEGEAVLRVGRMDHSPRRIQGQFRDGIFMGNDPFPNRIIALLPGDFLIHLPSSPGDDAEFWIHKRFLPDGLELALGNRGYPPYLLVVAPQGLSATEEDAIRDLMRRAYNTYCMSCQPVREAWVQVVPRKHVRKIDNNQTVFEPLMAIAQVAKVSSGEMQFYHYQNPEAKAAEQRRKAKQREEARRREQEMGPLRGRPDVRGVRLGMRVEEVWEVLQGEIAELEGARETPGEDRRYFRPLLNIRLQDGARIKAEFTSRVSGSQLFLIVYEQYYREGVTCKEVAQKLETKYGKPDDLDRRPSGAQWATYGLVSAMTPPDTAFGPGGAFFKTSITPRYKTAFAEKLNIVFNDATLGYHDEAAIHEDRRDAARRKFEESKSDKVKF